MVHHLKLLKLLTKTFGFVFSMYIIMYLVSNSKSENFMKPEVHNGYNNKVDILKNHQKDPSRATSTTILPAVELELEKTRKIMEIIEMDTSEVVLNYKSTVIRQPSALHECKDDGRDLLILFMFITAPSKFSQRNTIREIYREGIPQWQSSFLDSDIKSSRTIFKTLFFVGITSNKSIDNAVRLEWELEGDMIIDDFQEAYLNLTVKSLRMLKWVETYCHFVHYLIKIDDDVHLNVPLLMQQVTPYSRFLKSTDDPSGKFIIGGIAHHSTSPSIKIKSKWFTPRFLWNGTFPTYVGGFFYILGTEARSQLYRGALKSRIFHMEDVFLTGMVRERHTSLKVTGIPEIYTKSDFMQGLQCNRFKSILVGHRIPENRIWCYAQILQKDFTCNGTVADHCK